MKNIKSNLHYFEISKANPEKLLDDFYIFDEKNPDLDKYIQNTKEIKNILITIKTLKTKKENPEIIEKYFLELQKNLGEYSNCSEFGCFINACDNFIDSAKDGADALKEITYRYFQKRILNEVVPEEWVQAILDSNSSRKKGKCGENKLARILGLNGIKEVSDWPEFLRTDYCILRFSKKINLKSVYENLNIKIKTKKQNKALDLIIKIGKDVLICEAKHLNTAGGGQDKQISELIEIVGLRGRPGIYYIAFLDGKYSNVLLSGDGLGDKINKQRQEIARCLKKNSGNFWVNTAGFKALIKDFKN